MPSFAGPKRRWAAGVLAAAVLAWLLLFGVKGNSAERVALSGSGAWLVSTGQGLATLVDGASEQVIGSVRVAAPETFTIRLTTSSAQFGDRSTTLPFRLQITGSGTGLWPHVGPATNFSSSDRVNSGVEVTGSADCRLVRIAVNMTDPVGTIQAEGSAINVPLNGPGGTTTITAWDLGGTSKQVAVSYLVNAGETFRYQVWHQVSGSSCG